MPEPNDNKGAGDNNNAGQGAGQNQNALGEDEVAVKKSELEKIKSDSENYKSMGNKYKEDAEKWQTHEKTEAEKKNQQQQNQNQGQFDESKVSEITEKKIREANQRTAQGIFFKGIPEEEKTAILAELYLSGKELTVEEITDRLESARLEHKRKTGKLDEYLNSEREKGRREGQFQSQINQAHGYGSSGDKNEAGKEGTLSPKGEEMARAMHTDPEKVKKVDTQKDNVIDVLKPKNK